MTYGFMNIVRTIHLDMDSHPENITPSLAGHSIGKWEGDTLVVDTIGFEEEAYDELAYAKTAAKETPARSTLPAWPCSVSRSNTIACRSISAERRGMR